MLKKIKSVRWETSDGERFDNESTAFEYEKQWLSDSCGSEIKLCRDIWDNRKKLKNYIMPIITSPIIVGNNYVADDVGGMPVLANPMVIYNELGLLEASFDILASEFVRKTLETDTTFEVAERDIILRNQIIQTEDEEAAFGFLISKKFDYDYPILAIEQANFYGLGIIPDEELLKKLEGRATENTVSVNIEDL